MILSYFKKGDKSKCSNHAMARHNEARLLGYLKKDPIIKYADEDQTIMARVNIRLTTIRGRRDFGAKDRRKDYDDIIVMSRKPDQMKFMAKLHANDIIDVKGNLVTPKIQFAIQCPNCKEKLIRVESIQMINPIFMNYVETTDYFQTMDPENKMSGAEKAQRYLRNRTEIANNITLIGKCVRAPGEFVERGTIVNYALDVPRKYRIREDDPDHRHDFPEVKCYGKIAENDMKYVKVGSRLFIDGFIMSRNYEKNEKCEKCGYAWKQSTNVNEVVPYSVEYLSDCADGYQEINNEINEGRI